MSLCDALLIARLRNITYEQARFPMRRRLNTRFLLSTLCVPALLFGALAWLTYAQAQREKATLALVAAVKRGDTADVRRLLERGADPNAREGGVKRVSMGQALLDLWNRIRGRRSARANKGTPVLLLAAADADIVKLLLEHGADPNVRGMGGKTPLMIATSWANVRAAAYLLDHKADVNAKDDYGDTALINSVTMSRSPLVRLLLEHGADVHVRNQYGRTVLLLAMPYGDYPGTDLASLKMLLDAGAEVNARDSDGMTPLMHMARGDWYNQDHTPLAALLLARGADVNARDAWGRTALMYAMGGDTLSRNKIPIVRFLLRHGADAHIRDKQGRGIRAYADRDDPRLKPLLRQAGVRL
jgi:ankyrin repeat protein